ncbi:uncharacterized protein LOC122090609 [Macadamia integrifolia]|uniref:uncharacterized protein LOC122090609 n=1 Tax=Macadamia integrifolia TaxID=60698 RepID=UPI001C4FD2EE|nr:uncharacterized protein LOC122090609 [Macadamia integrifolia]XP_042516181.1 uncharacterized protein LOC122090609 [Macadamia integrifolia]XP_042516182.1 uncharacterized protein LOC122090609 [Macadamia integrifolia]
MWVLFGKFHCPSFICFCKPSSHLLSPSPLKLENIPHVPSPLSSVPDAVGQFSSETIGVKNESFNGNQVENFPKSTLHLSVETIEVKNESFNGNQVENFPKSSLKKPSSESGVKKEVEKARVQWIDFLGKELVEIKEFEPSESEDSDDEGQGHRGCVCVIQ